VKVALLGLMQSGKSTLLAAVSGKEPASAGTTTVDEVMVKVPDERLDWLVTELAKARDRTARIVARILVCGTLAYDIIGTFQGALATTKRNIKLVALTQAFGGCAMNIAYNLRRLGHQPVPFVYVGDDFAPTYQTHVKRLEISPEAMVQIPDSSCARGIVLTDRQGDQFTAFFPGPTGLDRHAEDLRRLTGETWDAANRAGYKYEWIIRV